MTPQSAALTDAGAAGAVLAMSAVVPYAISVARLPRDVDVLRDRSVPRYEPVLRRLPRRLT